MEFKVSLGYLVSRSQTETEHTFPTNKQATNPTDTKQTDQKPQGIVCTSLALQKANSSHRATPNYSGPKVALGGAGRKRATGSWLFITVLVWRKKKNHNKARLPFVKYCCTSSSEVSF